MSDGVCTCGGVATALAAVLVAARGGAAHTSDESMPLDNACGSGARTGDAYKPGDSGGANMGDAANADAYACPRSTSAAPCSSCLADGCFDAVGGVAAAAATCAPPAPSASEFVDADADAADVARPLDEALV